VNWVRRRILAHRVNYFITDLWKQLHLVAMYLILTWPIFLRMFKLLLRPPFVSKHKGIVRSVNGSNMFPPFFMKCFRSSLFTYRDNVALIFAWKEINSLAWYFYWRVIRREPVYSWTIKRLQYIKSHLSPLSSVCLLSKHHILIRWNTRDNNIFLRANNVPRLINSGHKVSLCKVHLSNGTLHTTSLPLFTVVVSYKRYFVMVWLWRLHSHECHINMSKMNCTGVEGCFKLIKIEL
jgi:hypothetical protein